MADEMMESATEAVKQILAKSVTALGSVLLSDKGMDSMLALVAPASAGSAMPLKLLSLMAAYAIWTQAVVPTVEALFKKLMPPKAGTAAAAPGKSRWSLM